MRREILIDCATPETRIALLEDDVSHRGVRREAVQPRHHGKHLQGARRQRPAGECRRPSWTSAPAATPSCTCRNLEARTGDVDHLETGAVGDPRPDEVEAPPAPERIEDRLKSGQELLVQVSKVPCPRKGARLTSLVSFPRSFPCVPAELSSSRYLAQDRGSGRRERFRN